MKTPAPPPAPPSAPSASPPGRIRSVQYLRAVAALAVVALHAGERVDSHLPGALHGALGLGHAGVDLFFVISGFIMWTIGREFRAGPGTFLLRRAIRVVPLYWIATLGWVALMLGAGATWISLAPDHVLRSLLFVPHWSPTFPDRFWPVLVPGWTLIFEMFFYAVFALALLLAAPGRRLAAVVAALAGLVALGPVLRPEAAPLVAYTSPLLLEFLAGCLVAEAWRRDLLGPRGGAALAAAGLLALIALGPQAATDQTSWSRPLILGTATAMIVWGAVAMERVVPRWPLLERLGDASYAIYLFHLYLVVVLAEAWRAVPGLHSGGAAVAFVAVVLCGASAMGFALHLWLERPVQRHLSTLAKHGLQGGRAGGGSGAKS